MQPNQRIFGFVVNESDGAIKGVPKDLGYFVAPHFYLS
jgi:hypothetical protein